MSNSVSIDKTWFNLELLKEPLIQLQKFEDCNYRNNFKEIRQDCFLCKIESRSGRCSAFCSIGKLCRHIDNVHQPTDVDGKKLKSDYLEYLKCLSVVIHRLNGNHKILIDFIKFGVKREML